MNSTQTWEKVFPDAILSVEELLNTGDISLFNKSKLRIALENNLLSWIDYKNWAINHFNVPVLDVTDSETKAKLRSRHLEQKESLSHIQIWNDDLIAIDHWDGQIIVLGLEYNPIKLHAVPGCVFILCSADLLDQLSSEAGSAVESLLELENLTSETIEANEDILSNSEYSPPELLNLESFENLATSSSDIEDNLTFVPEKTLFATTTVDLTTHIWKNINTNHQDFSDIARKNFDAYLVLRVTSDQKTELYKMDEELEKEELNSGIFVYDLKEENPFHNVYKNHFTETFNLNQLGLKILDFKYACISAIKLGSKVVGFIVGFKTTHLSQDDISTLESISEKAV